MARRLVPEAWREAVDYAGSQLRSVYHVFFALLPLVREAHCAANNDLLLRGYAFAEWCAQHQSKDLSNAAGVAFYEHLFDGGQSSEEVVPWLTAETYADVKGLLAARLGDALANQIEHAMRARRQTHGPALAALIKQMATRQELSE
jgi:hypothetical protein